MELKNRVQQPLADLPMLGAAHELHERSFIFIQMMDITHVRLESAVASPCESTYDLGGCLPLLRVSCVLARGSCWRSGHLGAAVLPRRVGSSSSSGGGGDDEDSGTLARGGDASRGGCRWSIREGRVGSERVQSKRGR